MQLSSDKLSQIVGKVFKSTEESCLTQEFALVRVTDENYYSLTELRLFFLDDQATGLLTNGLCAICGKDSDKKCGACGL